MARRLGLCPGPGPTGAGPLEVTKPRGAAVALCVCTGRAPTAAGAPSPEAGGDARTHVDGEGQPHPGLWISLPPWAASPARFRQEQSRGRGCDSKSRVVDEREVGGSRAGVEPGGRARLRWNVGPLPPLGRRPLSATPRTCQSPGRVALVCDPSDTLAVLSDSCICVSRITGRVTMPGLPEKRAVVCQDQSGFQGVDVCAPPRRRPRGHPCPRFTLG